MADALKAHKSLKPENLYDDQHVLDIAFASWKNKPIISITKDKVAKHHKEMSSDTNRNPIEHAMICLRHKPAG